MVSHDPHAHAAPQGFIRKWIFSLDHKVIGLQYFFLALVAVFTGMFLSLLMRIKVMPFARMSSVVVMKFSAPISAPMQKIAMLMIHRSAPKPSPGPADGSALSGA